MEKNPRTPCFLYHPVLVYALIDCGQGVRPAASGTRTRRGTQLDWALPHKTPGLRVRRSVPRTSFSQLAGVAPKPLGNHLDIKFLASDAERKALHLAV